MCASIGSNQRLTIYASVHSQPADLSSFWGTHCKKLLFVWKRSLSMIYLGSKIKPTTVCFIITIHIIIDHRTMTITYKAKSIVNKYMYLRVCAFLMRTHWLYRVPITKHLDTTTSCSNAWLSVHDIVFR